MIDETNHNGDYIEGDNKHGKNDDNNSDLGVDDTDENEWDDDIDEDDNLGDDDTDKNEWYNDTDEDVEDDELGDYAVPHLLLHEVEAHGDHGDAEEEVEGAEGDPGLPVLHLLVRSQVSEADRGQGDETEVGAG